jgi:cardiolipin synthase A/B
VKGYVEAEEITLVHSGTNYFEVLEQIIDEAKVSIQFQTYIFENDETGIRIINALKRAAQRRVQIHLLIDAFGSVNFSRSLMNELKALGIHCRKFSPLFSSESIFFGRRLHWKIIVADKAVSLTGGINVANKYNTILKELPWLDYAVLAKGRCCEYLHLLCDRTYHRRSRGILKKWQESMYLRKYSGKLIAFRINDWFKRKNEIYTGYLSAIKHANQGITIVSSYFLPGFIFRRALANAAARGVKVTIILTGKSDVSTVRSAEIYLYDFYFRHKFNIYEWNNSVMHGKAMVVDDEWATIGSYNVNFLSRFISVELNTDIKSKQFASEFSGHLSEVMLKGCKLISPHTLEKRRNLYFRIKIWLAYNFYRVIMNIFVKERKRS